MLVVSLAVRSGGAELKKDAKEISWRDKKRVEIRCGIIARNTVVTQHALFRLDFLHPPR